MSKLFVFSNSFLSRTLMYKIDFLLNINIDTVILLKENHTEEESFQFNNHIKTEMFRNIDDCISHSDYIFVINDKHLQEQSIKYIRETSEKENKIYFEITNPWCENHQTYNINEQVFQNKEFNNYPVILNISIGPSTQHFCGELLLHKILFENKIKVKQYFTNETRLLLNQISKYDILNNSINSSINCEIKKYDIIVFTLCIDMDFNRIKEYTNIIKYINPDYVMIQTNACFMSYELIKNYLKYGCFLNLDIVVKSHYTFISNQSDNDKVYCSNINTNSKKSIFDIESGNIEEQIAFEIFSKLSIPNNMRRITGQDKL